MQRNLPQNNFVQPQIGSNVDYIYAVGANNRGVQAYNNQISGQHQFIPVVAINNIMPVSTDKTPLSYFSPQKDNPLNYSIEQFNVYLGETGQKGEYGDGQPTVQNEGWVGVVKKKKWIFIGIGIALTLVILGIGLGIAFGRKKDPENTTPSNTIIFSCDVFPDSCTGVNQAVRDYVLSTYTDPDQAQSFLQTSRSIDLLPTSNVSSVPRQNLTDIFRNITRSVECMALNMPNGYADAFQKLSQLQFTTQTQLEAYLTMMESFSGQPLRLANTVNLEQTCRFNLTQSRRRLLQQSPNNTNNTSSCGSNATSVLIYFSGIGYSPSSAIQNVYKMQEILSTNSSTNFDAGIIAVGAWRRDGNLGYFSDFITSYENYARYIGWTAISRLNSYSLLRMVLNLCRSSAYLPASISMDTFNNFMTYYVKRSLQSFIDNESYYQISRHMNFVVNQIDEGKKVTLAAHAEGAYYANRVYQMLNSTQKQYVSLVYIAPTVSSMADGSTNYITNPNDVVIQGIRNNSQSNSSIPIPLPANVPAANFISELDLGSHHELPGYAQAYKTQLTDLIVSAKNRTLQPTRRMGSGPITITLTWDSQPDIDLHVLEPNQQHVFYSHRNGTSGYLDMDDTSAYGPEHYYTNCNLATGNYTVYLHFYGGYAASTTITTISAGSQYFMKTITFSPGQNMDVCIINVQYDNSTSSYIYTIYPK